jgi:metallo-beta-lactamase family protein
VDLQIEPFGLPAHDTASERSGREAGATLAVEKRALARVTFVGACGTVTGSCTLLEFGERRLLVDCGLFQGDEATEARNWQPFPFAPADLDGVLLTHAHLDHAGLVPKLVAQGFRGPVWCTRPTRPLAQLVLEDAAELQEEEARYAARKGYSRHREPRPLFAVRDARAALERFEPLRFHDEVEILPGIRARFDRAGHLLGAASITLAAKGADGERRRWLFSGDLGRYGAPILVDPEAPPGAPDAVVLESTYGDRRHAEDDPLAALADAVARTFERGGKLLIPAFALGRTQDVLYHLSALVDRGELAEDDVFLDSPMAIRATEIYHQAEREFDAEMRALVANGDSPLAHDRFRRARTVAESKALNDLDRPAVIVASSGMAAGGRIVHHLARHLPDPRSTVVFVGYQAAGTRGRALLDGASRVSIHGRRVDVAAEIRQIHGLSAHGDCEELMRWCRGLAATPARLFLNHGEDAARKALACALEEAGWPRAELPLAGDTTRW